MIQTILLWVGGGLLVILGIYIVGYTAGYSVSAGWHSYKDGLEKVKKRRSDGTN